MSIVCAGPVPIIRARRSRVTGVSVQWQSQSERGIASIFGPELIDRFACYALKGRFCCLPRLTAAIHLIWKGLRIVLLQPGEEARPNSVAIGIFVRRGGRAGVLEHHIVFVWW